MKVIIFLLFMQSALMFVLAWKRDSAINYANDFKERAVSSEVMLKSVLSERGCEVPNINETVSLRIMK